VALDEEVEVSCPYCGERVAVAVDAGDAGQELVEDCAVCCRPMRLRVEQGDEGTPTASASREDD